MGEFVDEFSILLNCHPEYEAEAKRPPRMEVEIVQEEEDDDEDGDSGDGSNARGDFVAISDDESGGARSSAAEAGHTVEAAADAFGDIPIRSGDIKGDVDTISMMSVEGGNLLFQNGAAAKRSVRGSRSSSDLSMPCLADVPTMVDKSVGTDDRDGNGNKNLTEKGKSEKESRAFKCVEPGCNIEFSRRQHLEQHVALHTKSEEFPCNLCKKVFYHEMSLKKHRMLHENAGVVLKCPECGEGVRRGKRGLRNGIQKFYSASTRTSKNRLFFYFHCNFGLFKGNSFESHNPMFRAHMDTHHVFVRCLVCNTDIPKTYARQHARKEHPDEVYNEVKENVYQGSFSVKRKRLGHVKFIKSCDSCPIESM